MRLIFKIIYLLLVIRVKKKIQNLLLVITIRVNKNKINTECVFKIKTNIYLFSDVAVTVQ